MNPRNRSMVVVARMLAAALVLAGVVVAWPPGSASAESPDAVGWWSKTTAEFPSELGGDPTPQPPDVPDNGFVVANDPTEGSSGEINEGLVPEEAGASPDDAVGPVAITALRFEATRARKAVLTLEAGEVNPATGEKSEDATFPPNASMVACPVVGQWEQVSNGAWEKRPELDCVTVASPGELSEDLTTVTFEINEEFFRLGVLVSTIEIGLRPEPGYAQPFRSTFDRPGFDALVADGPLVGFDGPQGGSEVGPPPTLPPPAPAAPTPGPAGAFDKPVGAPVGADSESGARRAQPVGQETAAPLPAPDSTTDRILAGVLLALLGVGLFLVTIQQPHQPRLLGGLSHRANGQAAGEPPAGSERQERGLGRFRRPRERVSVD